MVCVLPDAAMLRSGLLAALDPQIFGGLAVVLSARLGTAAKGRDGRMHARFALLTRVFTQSVLAGCAGLIADMLTHWSLLLGNSPGV